MRIEVQCIFLWILFLCTATTTAKLPFQWISCGNSSDVITIQQLEVYQNSSSEIFVTGEGTVALDVVSPISGTVDMKKKILGVWMPVPCVDNVGTCSYADICSLSPYKTVCPEIYQNLPCNCPIHRGKYSANSLPVDVNILPHWMEQGLYSIRLDLTSAGKRVLCLKMNIDL